MTFRVDEAKHSGFEYGSGRAWKFGESGVKGLTSQEPKPCCRYLSLNMRLLRHFAALGCSYSSGNEKRPLVCRRF